MQKQYFVRGEFYFCLNIEANDSTEAKERTIKILKENLQKVVKGYEFWWILATPEYKEESGNVKKD